MGMRAINGRMEIIRRKLRTIDQPDPSYMDKRMREHYTLRSEVKKAAANAVREGAVRELAEQINF